MTTEKTLSINDEVWRRVVQIVQEAMLMGVDCVDLLRQIRVQENGETLVLTSDYKQMVKEHHEKMVKDAEELRSAQQASKIIGRS